MPLNGYGLLIGTVTSSRPPRGTDPHWLLMVQPRLIGHPAYRVGVNVPSKIRGQNSEFDFQIADLEGARATKQATALAQTLKELGATPSFLLSGGFPTNPRLDFVRGGILNPARFADVATEPKLFRSAFQDALAEAMTKGSTSLVAVFGTGYPIGQTKGATPTGFSGVENIHMNQGSLNLVNGGSYYLENGPDQDGGVIFLFPSGAKGFFVKFHTQTTQTDAAGNPTITGIPLIDKTPSSIRRAIMPTVRRAKEAGRPGPAKPARPSAKVMSSAAAVNGPQPNATTNPKGYFFADFNPDDASGTYIPDDDEGTYKTPYVMTRSTGKTKGPVPSPRTYPQMDLSTVVGSNPPGYAKDISGERINFDIIGDSGAPSQHALDTYESKVTDLIARDAQNSPPAFLFHVGDVVYFYGEENYYYSQFYEPFRAYPAPIFAIPGNHDGITYNDSMVSLSSFQQAFCAATPGRWAGSGGILRSTMTQPGVYFTLNAPLVSIIGLYTNCGESMGWLDDQQLLFFYHELLRLKAQRKSGLPAVILAVHHFPRWFPGQSKKDPMSDALDATCKKAGFWPDAIICGHAHLYQRVVRQDTGQDIPYVLSGAGGYGISQIEEVGKPYMTKLASGGTKLGRLLFEAGYVRAGVTSPAQGDPTLQFEYHSVNQTTDQPDDVCTLNLRTNKVL